MAIYRQVHTCFWSDTKILDEMNYTERYFYLYLLTNPHVNQSGCYEISITQIINESGISRKEINNLLDKFENTFKLIKYCNETKELLIINFYKYNWTSSPKVKICIQNEISKIKSNDLIGYIRGIFNKIYPMQTGSQEKEKEKEKEKENKKENKKENINNINNNININKSERDQSFTPTASPTLAEIYNYACSLDINDKDYCEKFYNHYESIGWVNGTGREIKNWKLVFNNWLKKDNKQKDRGEINQECNLQ